MNKFFIIINTLVHLRAVQIQYQLWYRLRKIGRTFLKFNYPLSIEKVSDSIELQSCIEKPISYESQTFTFLNVSKRYLINDIDWNEPEFGKLWAYNLNYMDYLLQPSMSKEFGIQLILQFIQDLPKNKTGLDPYPIALRSMNWIKFLSRTQNRNEFSQNTSQNGRERKQIDSSLYAQLQILNDNLEYHLLANHLLEDGFSLLFGAFYFSDQKLYNKGKELVKKELEEQILDDGAHFELSPMYHQIILDRLLDCINLLQNNQRFDDQELLLGFMQDKVQKMLSWLNTITFATGEIPLLNDAAPGIAPSTQQLNEYADRLKLNGNTSTSSLGACGYRKFSNSTFECIIDIGQIGPSYQPGHAHSDTFNFVLNIQNRPGIIDTGISTYNAGSIRLNERGTAAHNTITVKEKNSSEVWSSFRVARRARVEILKDDHNHVIAQHDGYRKLSTQHRREWKFDENEIKINDDLIGRIKNGKAHFIFSPEENPTFKGNIIETKNMIITFENSHSINLLQTENPSGYNNFLKTMKAEVSFTGTLKTTITPRL